MKSPLARRRQRQISQDTSSTGSDSIFDEDERFHKKSYMWNPHKPPDTGLSIPSRSITSSDFEEAQGHDFLFTVKSCRPKKSHARCSAFSDNFHGIMFENTSLTAISEKKRLEETIEKRKAVLKTKRNDDMQDMQLRMVREILLLKQKQQHQELRIARRRHREEVRNNILRKQSAIKIQSLYRGKKTRQEYGQLIKQYESFPNYYKKGMISDTDFDGTFITGVTAGQEHYEYTAATAIQMFIRRNIKSYQMRKAVLKIQALQRAKAARKEYEKIKEEVDSASSLIQAYYRGIALRHQLARIEQEEALLGGYAPPKEEEQSPILRLGRHRAKKKRETNIAATKLQKHFRGFQARNDVAAKEDAVLKIQVTYRRASGTLDPETMKEINETYRNSQLDTNDGISKKEKLKKRSKSIKRLLRKPSIKRGGSRLKMNIRGTSSKSLRRSISFTGKNKNKGKRMSKLLRANTDVASDLIGTGKKYEDNQMKTRRKQNESGFSGSKTRSSENDKVKRVHSESKTESEKSRDGINRQSSGKPSKGSSEPIRTSMNKINVLANDSANASGNDLKPGRTQICICPF